MQQDILYIGNRGDKKLFSVTREEAVAAAAPLRLLLLRVCRATWGGASNEANPHIIHGQVGAGSYLGSFDLSRVVCSRGWAIERHPAQDFLGGSGWARGALHLRLLTVHQQPLCPLPRDSPASPRVPPSDDQAQTPRVGVAEAAYQLPAPDGGEVLFSTRIRRPPQKKGAPCCS